MDKFLPTLAKGFPRYVINVVLSCKNSQQQQPIFNINSSTPNKNRNQYNTLVDYRTRILTMLSLLVININRVCRYKCILHSVPKNNTYGKTVIAHTSHAKDGKIDITTMQHHSDHNIQTVISKAFTIGVQSGEVIT